MWPLRELQALQELRLPCRPGGTTHGSAAGGATRCCLVLAAGCTPAAWWQSMWLFYVLVLFPRMTKRAKLSAWWEDDSGDRTACEEHSANDTRVLRLRGHVRGVAGV